MNERKESESYAIVKIENEKDASVSYSFLFLHILFIFNAFCNKYKMQNQQLKWCVYHFSISRRLVFNCIICIRKRKLFDLFCVKILKKDFFLSLCLSPSVCRSFGWTWSTIVNRKQNKIIFVKCIACNDIVWSSKQKHFVGYSITTDYLDRMQSKTYTKYTLQWVRRSERERVSVCVCARARKNKKKSLLTPVQNNWSP